MEKRGPMSSRWAIGCCPFDRTTSTSEDGEVICNEKKSQEYRRTAQIPESRIIVVCPFVKRSAEDRLRITMNLLASEIVIVDREERGEEEDENVDQSFELIERYHPGCWSKIICTKSLVIAEE